MVAADLVDIFPKSRYILASLLFLSLCIPASLASLTIVFEIFMCCHLMDVHSKSVADQLL